MTSTATRPLDRLDQLIDRVAPTLTSAGHVVGRYGLVIVLVWFGYGKYVKMDSRTLIEHSPLTSWIYGYLDPATVAASLGTLELVAAALILARPLWPWVCAAGSALTVVLFVGTLSFLFTTPNVVIGQHLGFLPVLSAQPGQFLLKDLVLIGVAIWSLGESLTAARVGRAASSIEATGVASARDGR